MADEEQPLINADLRRQLRAEAISQIDEFRQRIADLVAIIDDTPNATIAATPAPYIKGLAREVVALARQTLRLAMLVNGVFDNADTGIDPEE